MKILITMYNINSPGGIINHNENLIGGFKDLGHSVDFIELVWRDSIKAKGSKDSSNYEIKESGIPVHQGKGWLFPQANRFAYKGDYNLRKWKQHVSGYDLIIWQIPVPTKQRDNEGNTDWLALYDLPEKIKQIAIIHDGNLQKSYPWITQISQHLSGLACVHPCAYHGANVVDVPRALILNPQKLPLEDKPSWDSRDYGFISMQTFKGWKHVDDLVRAIPHMSPYMSKQLAGGGIEHNYMTSRDKCKPQYFVSQERDPDISEEHYGQKIWDVAVDHGMKWHGYLTETEIKNLLQKTQLVIDPSWSKAYASIGDHFNRVVVDGIIEGAIPIARNLGISTNVEGVGEVFKPNENYFMVPYDATPKEFAETVEFACNIESGYAQDIRDANRNLLRHFDRERVASQYIALAQGYGTGFYDRLELGIVPEDILYKTEKTMTEFFGLKAVI